MGREYIVFSNDFFQTFAFLSVFCTLRIDCHGGLLAINVMFLFINNIFVHLNTNINVCTLIYTNQFIFTQYFIFTNSTLLSCGFAGTLLFRFLDLHTILYTQLQLTLEQCKNCRNCSTRLFDPIKGFISQHCPLFKYHSVSE